MFLPWTEAGWRVEEGVSALSDRIKMAPPLS
jgi:hypothetical protein